MMKQILLNLLFFPLLAQVCVASASELFPEEPQLDDYMFSPLARVLTKEQYETYQEDTRKDIRSGVMEGKVITLNTKNRAGCDEARRSLNLEEKVCFYNEASPLVSVIVMRPVEDQEFFRKEVDGDGLSDKQKTALKAMLGFGLAGVGTAGLIYMLPESISNWDKSRGFYGLTSRYNERIMTPPVIDSDHWAINYIGHPVSGAYYYTVVRHAGFSITESAVFSVFMSTFFWEYGLEAFAEVPSIQDLILTPLVGSIIGEAFHQALEAIDRNDGKIFGSKALGRTATVLMNPGAEFTKGINKLAGLEIIKHSELALTNKPPFTGPVFPSERRLWEENYYGLEFSISY